jgi:lipoprotein-anchoring transpeptidase ErfK/SrfK
MSGKSEISARFTRRHLLSMGAVGAASAALSACTSIREQAQRPMAAYVQPEIPTSLVGYQEMYGTMVDGEHVIPAVPIEKVDPRYYRQIVPNTTGEAPGTIVVDTANHFLYLTRDDGQAMRYGVGLGREGFEWAGRGVIEWKQHWPRWFPPEEMIAREPELEKYRAIQVAGTNQWEGGMPGGITNPLGARALYIYQDGKDTLYRIHGSPEWASIGKSVSSGCVRLMNQDIIDLYDRVPEGTPILVRGGAGGFIG